MGNANSHQFNTLEQKILIAHFAILQIYMASYSLILSKKQHMQSKIKCHNNKMQCRANALYGQPTFGQRFLTNIYQS